MKKKTKHFCVKPRVKFNMIDGWGGNGGSTLDQLELIWIIKSIKTASSTYEEVRWKFLDSAKNSEQKVSPIIE